MKQDTTFVDEPCEPPAYSTRSKKRANPSKEDHPAKQFKNHEEDSPSSNQESTIAVEVPDPSEKKTRVQPSRGRPKTAAKAEPQKQTRPSKPKKTLQQLNKENKDLKEDLKRVTQESIQNARKGGQDPWDDAKIKKHLKDLDTDLLTWARTYAVNSAFPDLDANEKTKFGTIFQKSSPYEGICGQQDVEAIRKLPNGSVLVTESLLWRFCCSEFLDTPFALLNNAVRGNWLQFEVSQGRQTSMIEANYEQFFYAFRHDLAMVDPYQSQKWVSAMLGVIKPAISPEENPNASERKDDRMYQTHHQAIKDLAETFLAGPASVILRVVHGREITTRRNKLVKLLGDFREIAFHMFYQGVNVKYCYPTLFGAPVYDPKSDMDLHRMIWQPSSDDIDDWKKDPAGDDLILITKPTIAGNIWDADDHKKVNSKIWINSTVWPKSCYARGKRGKPAPMQAMDAPLPESRRASCSYSEATEPIPGTVKLSVEDARDYQANPSYEYPNGLYDQNLTRANVNLGNMELSLECGRGRGSSVASIATNVEGIHPNDVFY